MPAKHYPHKPTSNDDLGHGRTVVHYSVSLTSSSAILSITSISVDPVENASDTVGMFFKEAPTDLSLANLGVSLPPTAGSGRALGAARPEPARLSPSPASRLRPRWVTIADAGFVGGAATEWSRRRVRGMTGKEKGGAGAGDGWFRRKKGLRPPVAETVHAPPGASPQILCRSHEPLSRDYRQDHETAAELGV